MSSAFRSPSHLNQVARPATDPWRRRRHLSYSAAQRVLGCLLLCFGACASWAASSVNVTFDEQDILAWNSGTDTAPRGLEVLSDGRLVYFEDSNTPSYTSNRDAIVLFDPTKLGNARFTVIATKNQMKALATTYNHPNLTIGDLVRDPANNIYAIATEYNADKSETDNFVLMLPFNGAGYNAPVFVVDVPDGGLKPTSTTRHRVSVAGNFLYVLFDSLDSVHNTNQFGANGIYRCDRTANAPQLQLWTSYQTIGSVTSVQPAANDAFGLWQIRADGAGNLFGLVYVNGSAQPGDLIKIDANGQPSLWMSALQAESETGWLNGFGTTTSLAIDPNNGHMFFFETGTNTTEKELLYEFDENAQFIRQIAAGVQISLAAPNVSSLTTLESNALALGTDGKLYAFLSAENRETAVTIDPDGGTYTLPNFIWPNGADQYLDVASPFGPRQLTSENYRYDFHRGIDMTMPVDSKIYAVADGVVVTKTSKTVNDCNGISSTEYTLGIRHGNAPPYVYSFYLHLNSTYVNLGDVVSQGDPDATPTNHIALSGRKSESCYAHLHFETRVGSTQESTAVNPLTYLPYIDTTPTTPTLNGINSDADQRLYYYEFSAADEELDLNALSVQWQGVTHEWNWPIANKANGGTYDTRMDHPVVHFGDGIIGATFPEHINQSNTHATYGFVVAGLDAQTQSSGLASVTDLHAASGDLSLPLTTSDLSMLPVSSQIAADPGTNLELKVVLYNGTLQSENVNLDIISARANPITYANADHTFTLTPGQSREVVFTVALNPNAPYAVGDAILVSADHGTGMRLMSLIAIENNN